MSYAKDAESHAAKEKPVLSKQELYESAIAPIVARLAAACRAHGIWMVAEFQIDDAPREALLSTTMVVGPGACQRLLVSAQQASPPAYMEATFVRRVDGK